MIFQADTEKACLCCMILDRHCAEQGCGILVVDDFFLSTNKDIFCAIQAIVTSGGNPDVVLIEAECKRQGVPETNIVQALTDITTTVWTTMNFENYIKDLQECSWLRRCAERGNKLAEAAKKHELSTVYSVMDDIRNGDVGACGEIATAAEIMRQLVEKLDADRKSGVVFSGARTGFADYDVMTGGLQPGELTILAARPAMGKTAFAIDIMRNVARNQEGIVVYFSLEMSKEKIVSRMYCGDTGANNVIFSVCSKDDAAWAAFLDGLTQDGARFEEMASKVFIDDESYTSVEDMRKRCYKIRQSGKKVSMIAVDYIQLMSVTATSRVQEIDKISRGLKLLAKEFDCPVLALSQLSRAVEQRADHRPMLSDLRESGSIEQDADVVLFLYRDEYYFPDTEKKNQTEVIIAKQRNGPIGIVNLTWIPESTTFRNSDGFYPVKEKGVF